MQHHEETELIYHYKHDKIFFLEHMRKIVSCHPIFMLFIWIIMLLFAVIILNLNIYIYFDYLENILGFYILPIFFVVHYFFVYYLMFIYSIKRYIIMKKQLGNEEILHFNKTEILSPRFPGKKIRNLYILTGKVMVFKKSIYLYNSPVFPNGYVLIKSGFQDDQWIEFLQLLKKKNSNIEIVYWRPWWKRILKKRNYYFN